MGNKILCVGELLIDFICSDVNVSLSDGVNFVKKAGGAPANVTAAIAKLGGEALFAGKVGASLYKIAKLEDPRSLTKDFDKMKEITAFANKVGAIVCTKLGAIAALPTLEEVQ